jgi:hypothetical protein
MGQNSSIVEYMYVCKKHFNFLLGLNKFMSLINRSYPNSYDPTFTLFDWSPIPLSQTLQLVPSFASTMVVDRNNDLSDELLSYILSFIPTKLAFTTTVLYKRWTPFCYSLPVLHFEFVRENREQHVKDTFYRFSHFVDTLMLSHLSTNKPLETFLLICPFGKG